VEEQKESVKGTTTGNKGESTSLWEKCFYKKKPPSSKKKTQDGREGRNNSRGGEGGKRPAEKLGQLDICKKKISN